MFALCEGMKWSHLPVAGGIYDQHPDLLDAFRIIFHERAKYEEERAKKDKREMGRQSKPSRRGASRQRL